MHMITNRRTAFSLGPDHIVFKNIIIYQLKSSGEIPRKDLTVSKSLIDTKVMLFDMLHA
jgi:hypothetical protein